MWDDAPNGETTDFYEAVKADDNEEVILSWTEYPSKIVRDQVLKKKEQDLEIRGIGKNTPSMAQG